MHILIIHYGDQMGGLEMHLIELISGLRICGHRITAVVAPGRLAQELTRMNSASVSVFPPVLLSKPMFIWKYFKGTYRLLKDLRFDKPDIVHVHCRLMYPVAFFLSQVYHRPLIFTAHNTFIDKRWIPWFADHLVAVSSGVKKALSRFLFIKNTPTEIINYSIPAAYSDAPEDSPRTIDILCAARLVPEKGIHILLEAISELKSQYPVLRIVIAGEGPLREKLVELSHRLKLGKTVEFLGFVDNIKELYRSSKIFILPSLKLEGLPISLLEAMASGCAVVVSKNNGAEDVIKNGENGMLVPAGDIQGLAASLKILLDNPERRNEMSKKARESVRGRIHSQQMIHATVRVYSQHATGFV